MSSRPVLIALVLLAAAAATAAAQQNEYQQQVAAKLARHGSTVLRQGFHVDRPMLTGTLNADADESTMITLEAGTRYVITASCDDDCTDMDLQLYAADDTKLAEDVDTDPFPVLDVTPTATAQYRLRVMMLGCGASPCYYGVQIFAK